MTKQIHKLFKNAVFLLMVSCFFLLVQFTCISMEIKEKEEKISVSLSVSSFSSTQESNETPENSDASTTHPKSPHFHLKRRNSSYNSKNLSRRQSSEHPSTSKKNKTQTLKDKSSGLGSDPAILLSINSELPLTINSEMASILKKIEELTLNEMERRYLATVAYLIQNSASHHDTEKVVIYSYPLFTSERILFCLLTELKEIYPQQIIAVLTQLALEGFPHGIDHLGVEFNTLKNGLKLPPILSGPLLNKLFAEPSESIILTGTDGENYIKLKDFNLANCDGIFVKKFADFLANKNISLLSAIKLKDIKSYIEDEKSPPKSIAALEKHRNQVINWIAWQIVTQEDEEKRSRLFQRFFFIGLAHKHNFCSATMVAMALHKSVVKSLMSQKEKTNQNLVKLFELISPLKNNLNYRRLWSEFQIEGDCLPAFHILYQDAVTAVGTYKKILLDDYQSLAKGLAGIAQTLEPLSRCRTLSCSYSMEDDFKFVWEFDEVSDDVLEEFSRLRKQEIYQQQSQIPKELEKWTSEHFSFFLKQHNVSEKGIKKIEKKINKKIFGEGPCGGLAIIKYMGSPSQQLQRKKLEKLGLNDETISTILTANFGNV